MAIEQTTGIADAVNTVGTQDKLAELLGVTQQAISNWVAQGWVPMRRAQEIEAQTGILRERLVNPRVLELVSSTVAS
jgi:DNA-binding transcriptional regulator YdaS (Cro superfamily)